MDSLSNHNRCDAFAEIYKNSDFITTCNDYTLEVRKIKSKHSNEQFFSIEALPIHRKVYAGEEFQSYPVIFNKELFETFLIFVYFKR